METNYIKQQKSSKNNFHSSKGEEYSSNGLQQKTSRSFLELRLGKALQASSLFDIEDKKHRPNMIRRTSTVDLQTKSLKEMDLKGNCSRVRHQLNRRQDQFQQELESQFNYNESLVRLKVEEMIFKFKTRIGTLLKEMGISVIELNRFTSLSRIDEILDFLSQKVKEMIANRDIKSTQVAKVRSRDQDLLNEYQVQLQSLRKKQLEKEVAEKGLKQRLKEAHSQIRQLYDRVNRREKELSSKMTEIYQAKAIAEESDKVVVTLKEKYAKMEKECVSLRDNNNMENKKMITTLKTLQDENSDLKEKNEQLVQLIERYQSKEKSMIDLNRQLNQQLQRWRERFQTKRIDQQEITEKTVRSGTQKAIITSASIESNQTESGKVSQLALLNENSRLTFKKAELEKQNKDLTRQLAKFSSLESKYNQLLSLLNMQQNKKLLDNNKDSEMPIFGRSKYQSTIQLTYSKKIEENARQWREKLIEIVNTYEQQAEKNKVVISELMKNKQELEGKVHQLAILKYKVENELIEKDREIYQMSKSKKDNQRVISSLDITQRTPDKQGQNLQEMTERKEVEETPKQGHEEIINEEQKVLIDTELQADVLPDF